MGKESNAELMCFKTRVTHYANIELFEFLKAIPDFFKEYDYDFWEKAHAEKPDGVGYTLEIEWYGVRDINDYLRFKIEMKGWIRELRKIVYDNGETTHYGKIVLDIKGTMIKNYRGTFGKNKVEDYMRKIYERFVRMHELRDYEDKLANECVDFTLRLKSFTK